MTKCRALSLFVVTMLIAGSWSAHAHGGMGSGMGGGMGGGVGSVSGGYSGGLGSDVDWDGRIRYGFNRNNVFGWELMSEEERTAHGEKMLGIATYEECNAYQEQHHQQMEVRAKEKEVALSEPNNNACNRMKTKGFFK